MFNIWYTSTSPRLRGAALYNLIGPEASPAFAHNSSTELSKNKD